MNISKRAAAAAILYLLASFTAAQIAAPEFTADSYGVTLDEDAPAGVLTFSPAISATDAVRYSISAIVAPTSLTTTDTGTIAASLPFSINSNTGAVAVIRLSTLFPDFEALDTSGANSRKYVFEVTVTNTLGSDTAIVTVTINNVIETPRLSGSAYEARIAEDAVDGAAVDVAPVIDAQEVIVGYSISAIVAPTSLATTDTGTIATALPFSINPGTGAVTVIRSSTLFPDFEALDTSGANSRRYVFEVTATNAAGSDTARVTVRVTNVAERPQLSRDVYEIRIGEETASGPLDIEISANDAPTYSISSYVAPAGLEPEEFPFDIAAATGIISVINTASLSPDYEALEIMGANERSYVFVITAANAVDSDEATVRVRIDNFVEVPRLSEETYSARISEDASAGVLTITPRIVASEADVTYAIDSIIAPANLVMDDPAAALPFSIDPDTGVISVIRTDSLFPDYEALDAAGPNARRYVFDIRVGSAVGLDTAVVTIFIDNVIEAPKLSADVYSTSLGEDATARALVLTPAISATGEQIIHSISAIEAPDTLATNDPAMIAASLPFSINRDTGVISVVRSADLDLDFENLDTQGADARTYVFEITAMNTAGLDKARVRVRIINVNEPPALSADAYSTTIVENTTAILALEPPFMAADPDGDGLIYSLLPPDVPFQINANSGEITARSPDYEVLPQTGENAGQYVFTVVVTADGGSDSATVRVGVNNLLERLEFSADSYSRTLPDTAALQTAVGDPIAVSTDETAGSISYSLSGPADSPFRLRSDVSNGAQIELYSAIPAGGTAYELTLTATFTPAETPVSGPATLTAAVPVTINIDEEAATIRLGEVTVDEDAGVAQLPVLVTGTLKSPLDVDFAAVPDSTAVPDQDYSLRTTRVQIPAGTYSDEAAAEILIDIVDDGFGGEQTETLELLFSGGPPVGRTTLIFIGDPGVLRIRDNDSLRFRVESTRVIENIERAHVNVAIRLIGQLESDQTLVISTADGTATAGLDYTSLSSFGITFATSEQQEQVRTVELGILDDDFSEDVETFEISMNYPPGIPLPSGVDLSGGVVTILDDETLSRNEQRREELITIQAIAAKAEAGLVLDALQTRFASPPQFVGGRETVSSRGVPVAEGEQASLAGARGVNGITVWMHGGLRTMRGGRDIRRDRLEYDGESVALTVGTEQQWNTNLVTGVSWSHIESDIDYNLAADIGVTESSFVEQTELVSVYGAVRPVPSFLVWLVVGGGRGEVTDIRIPANAESREEGNADTELYMAAVGMDYHLSPVRTANPIDLDLIVAVYAVQKRTAELRYFNDLLEDFLIAVPKTTVDLYEMRLGARVGFPIPIADSGLLRPHVQLDLVRNDGEYPFSNLQSLDIKAGLTLDFKRLRLAVDGNLETLSGGQNFWGFRGEAKLLALGDGRGLSLGLSSQIGGADSWQAVRDSAAFSDPAGLVQAPPARAARLGLEGAYGFWRAAKDIVWEPYIRFSRGAAQTSSGLGLRLRPGVSTWRLDFGVQRLEDIAGSENDHQALLTFSSAFPHFLVRTRGR